MPANLFDFHRIVKKKRIRRSRVVEKFSEEKIWWRGNEKTRQQFSAFLWCSFSVYCVVQTFIHDTLNPRARNEHLSCSFFFSSICPFCLPPTYLFYMPFAFYPIALYSLHMISGCSAFTKKTGAHTCTIVEAKGWKGKKRLSGLANKKCQCTSELPLITLRECT